MLQQRNSSFEMIKVIAVVLIIFSSALPFGTTYVGGYNDVFSDLTRTAFSAEHMTMTLFRWFGQIGDTLFISCSAWFLCDHSMIRVKRIGKIIADSWILSILGLGVSFVFMNPTVKEVFESFFPITFQINWFVGCYILYYFAHPFLNRAVSGLDQKGLKKVVIVLLLGYSLLSTIYAVYYFTNLMAFFMIHYLVMYIKKYRIFDHPSREDIFCILAGITMILLIILLVNYLGDRISFIRSHNLNLCKYYNPLILLISSCAICLAAKKTFFSSVINKISSWSLLIYLIHTNHFWVTYGKYELYQRIGVDGILSVLKVAALYLVMIPILAFVYEASAGKLTGFLSGRIEYLMQE